ncbi:hypothetical protein GGI15_004527 [Coemansia interrupta]|uniref:Uncharacterized protein n=1 Tax=Coemansia interrupta TaxID=1126814 RepID=A0A9W8H5S8_9FUNG|nr:hypothetical protein GGI15_004527 [Coemansia interrupta]
MHALRVLLARSVRTRIVRQMSTSVDSASIIPKHLQPGPNHLEQSQTVVSRMGTLDISSPPANVRPELWQLFVTTLPRIDPKSTKQPKKSTLHWILLNAETKEELDMALQLTYEWRMSMKTITQATAQIWSEACIRLNYPEPFLTMLMDRWKYRQLPIPYTMARFIKFLGSFGSEERLDDAFRVFALYPYYQLKHDAMAYGALVEACCEVNTDEAWRRALVVSEETLANDPPMITLEALQALEKRSSERGEPEMADRYKNLATRLDLKPADTKEAQFDQNGNHIA